MGFYILPIHSSTNLTNQVIPQHIDNNSHLRVGRSIYFLLLILYYPVAVHVPGGVMQSVVSLSVSEKLKRYTSCLPQICQWGSFFLN